MRFLRQDKRKRLGLEDRDATGAFFSLCDTGEDARFKSRVRISASAQTFSGWAIPHSFFAQGKTIDAVPNQNTPKDPYNEERRFWRDLEHGSAAGLQKIFPLQKRSYDIWRNTFNREKSNCFSFFSSPVPVTDVSAEPIQKLLQDAILGKDNRLTVTPTRDLNVYFNCPIFWLYMRVFKVEEFSLEAALLDDTSLGLLYHSILEALFRKIKDEDGQFDSLRLDTYKRWALEITEQKIKAEPAFRGPLAVPLVSPQAAGMAKKITGLLDLEAKFFDGYGVAELELPVSFNSGDLIIKGIIDRVSISPEGEPVILDYKTSYLPEQITPDKLQDIPLSEFQMPLYIKLYEEMAGTESEEILSKVQGAYFYSIHNRKIKSVVGTPTGSRAKVPSRDEYTPFLEAAERQIEEFGQKVKALDFVPREIRIGDCFGCIYKTVCRSTYFLNDKS
jgi:hypothetical protein